jgi:hypothetical protein
VKRQEERAVEGRKRDIGLTEDLADSHLMAAGAALFQGMLRGWAAERGKKWRGLLALPRLFGGLSLLFSGGGYRPRRMPPP